MDYNVECFLVGACDQTWSSGEGYEDQDPGGNLSVFSANQGTKVDRSQNPLVLFYSMLCLITFKSFSFL